MLPEGAGVASKQNILFVVIDQLRADCVAGALANSARMRNLQALQSDAVSFAHHHSVTNPCGPSRVSILTGQYAMNHGVTRNGTPLAEDVPNLATEARRAGYAPRLYGYTDAAVDPRAHDPADPRMHSYEQVLPGFDEALEMRLEESWPWRGFLKAQGYDVPDYPAIFRPDGPRPDAPAFYRAEHSDTAFLTDRVIEDLRGRPQGWFAHVTYIRPHPPLVAPAPYNTLVDRDSLPAPMRPRPAAAERAAHPYNGPAMDQRPLAANVEGFPDLEESDENLAMLRAIYLGLAAEVDDHIGRLIDFLKDSGQYDETLIVVTADHGEMLGDHHQWGKMSYRNAAFHVPLIIRSPAHRAQFGRRVEAITESVDLAPTILDLIGQDIPDTMDGQSLRPFLEGQSPAGWRNHSFSELSYGDPLVPTRWQRDLGLAAEEANLSVLRTRDHVLVHFNGGLPPVLLARDGDHEAEVPADAASRDRMFEMTRQLLDHRMRHGGGPFRRSMITAEGLKRGTRGTGGAGATPLPLAQVS